MNLDSTSPGTNNALEVVELQQSGGRKSSQFLVEIVSHHKYMVEYKIGVIDWYKAVQITKYTCVYICLYSVSLMLTVAVLVAQHVPALDPCHRHF